VLQCVAVRCIIACCSGVLECVVFVNTVLLWLTFVAKAVEQVCVEMSCRVLQCDVSQCVAVCCGVL